MPIDTPKAMTSYPIAFHDALRSALRLLGDNPSQGVKAYGYIAAGPEAHLRPMRRRLKAFLRGARERFDSPYCIAVRNVRFVTTLTPDPFGEWELELVAMPATPAPLTDEKILEVLSKST